MTKLSEKAARYRPTSLLKYQEQVDQPVLRLRVNDAGLVIRQSGQAMSTGRTDDAGDG